MIFIAPRGESAPHFTTITSFVARLAEPIAQIFSLVLYLCDQEGLIGRGMFAIDGVKLPIDGVKLPSNASKHTSGTRADFQRQARKREAASSFTEERDRALPAPRVRRCASAQVVRRAHSVDRRSPARQAPWTRARGGRARPWDLEVVP